MRLAHEEFGGQGLPLLILHGLFGSSRNWLSVGRFLSSICRPYALDLRNHGRSPHSSSHSLQDLVGDLEQWIRENLAEAPALLGHSMGGQAAMGYALRHPRGVRGLIVVDIAPRAYRRDYAAQFRALRLELAGYGSRGEIDRALAPLLPDERLRRFLQTSIAQGPQGFRWILNGPALEHSSLVRGLSPGPDDLEGRYEGPALLLRGENSDFVGEEDLVRMAKLFPGLRARTLPGADHWVHATSPQAFRQEVAGFLQELVR